MSQTVLNLYNQALSAVRAKGRISSLDENSREREECEIWYETVRNTVQESAYWESCRTTERLTLLKERNTSIDWTAGDPESQYRYSYGLPSDCLRPWHLVTYTPFTLSFDKTRNRTVLNTNEAAALLIYARVSDNPAQWSGAQYQATVYGLAAQVAGPLSGNNALQSANINLANNLLLSAQSQSANTTRFLPDIIPPALQVRGYEDTFQTRYYYPHGSIFTGAQP